MSVDVSSSPLPQLQPVTLRALFGLALFGVALSSCKVVDDDSLASKVQSGQFRFDVNDVAIFWPLLPRLNRSDEPTSFLHTEFPEAEKIDYRRAHRVNDMLVLGNPLEEEMIHLTSQDHNELDNPAWADRSLLSVEDFRLVYCGAFLASVVETSPNPDTHKIKDPDGLMNYLYLSMDYPLQTNTMEMLCGKYKTGTGKRPVREFVDADSSFAIAAKPSLWRLVGLRFKLCAYPTKKLDDLLVGVGKITPKGALPSDIAKLCEPTLRAVVQPLDLPTHYALRGVGKAAFDFAMHLNYVLPAKFIVDLLHAIIAIKRYSTQEGHPTEGKPQYVHPGFGYADPRVSLERNDGLSDLRELTPEQMANAIGFSRVVRRQLMPFLQRQFLHDVQFFGTYVDQPTQDNGAAWVYATFDAKEGRIKQQPIVFVDDHPVMMYHGLPRLAAQTYQPNLSGQFVGVPSAQPLADAVLAPGDALGNLATAMQPVAALDDPRQYHIKGADCISCHLGQSLRTIAKRRGAAGLDDDYYPADESGAFKRLKLEGVTQSRSHERFVDAYFGERLFRSYRLQGVGRDVNYNMVRNNPIFRADYVQRQFGYFNTVPMISQRAINESAIDAKLLQTRVDLGAFLGVASCGAAEAPPEVQHEDVELPYYARYYISGSSTGPEGDHTMLHFWRCLWRPMKYRYDQGLSLVPTTAFLEALRRGPPSFESYTGFADLNECRGYWPRVGDNPDAAQFKTVAFAFMFGIL